MVVALMGKKLDSLVKTIQSSTEGVEIKTYKNVLELVNDINSDMLPGGIDRIIIRDNILNGSKEENQQVLLDFFDLLTQHFVSIRIISLSMERENADLFELCMGSVNAAHLWGGAGKITATVVAEMVTKKINDLKNHPYSVTVVQQQEEKMKKQNKPVETKTEVNTNAQQEKSVTQTQKTEKEKKKGFGLFGKKKKDKNDKQETNEEESTTTETEQENGGSLQEEWSSSNVTTDDDDDWGFFEEKQESTVQESPVAETITSSAPIETNTSFIPNEVSKPIEKKDRGLLKKKEKAQTIVEETVSFDDNDPFNNDYSAPSTNDYGIPVESSFEDNTQPVQDDEVDFSNMFPDVEEIEDAREFINNRTEEADTESMLQRAGLTEAPQKVKMGNKAEIIEEEIDFSNLGEDIDIESEEKAYKQEVAPEVVVREVEVVKEVVREVVKEVPSNKQQRYNRFVEMTKGKEHGVIIVTGDRRQGLTVNALNLAVEMKKKNPKLNLLYVDFDIERKGSLPYLGITDIIAEPDNIKMGVAGVKKAAQVKHFAYKPVNGFNFPCLISFYGINVTEKQLELADECIANQTDYDVVIIDCPIDKLKYLDSNLMDADIVFMCDCDYGAAINLIDILNNINIPNRIRTKMLNRGGFLINRKNSKDSFDKILKSVNDIFDMDDDNINWTTLKILGESKDLLKSMTRI